jgi:hypothetical protein
MQGRSESFKIKYGKLSDAVFNTANPILMQVKKNEKFVGKQYVENNPMGFAGSVGSRVLPKSNSASYENAILYSKKCYATLEVEREAFKASASDDGAFFSFMKEPTKKALESFMRNWSRQFFGDGTGILGKGHAGAADVTGAGTSGNPYVVTFHSSQWNEANFEEKDFVQVVTGIDSLGEAGTAEGGDTETNLLEIVEVVPASKVIKLVGTSAVLAARVAGTNPLGATDAIVMQRSYLGDLTGLRKVSMLSEMFDLATLPVGTKLYEVSLQRRWKMHVKDAANAALTKPLLNEMALAVDKKVGKTINIIVPSYEQFQKLLDLSEDQKRYTIVMPSAKEYQKAVYGFKAVEYMTTTGPVPVIPDRMVKPDEIFFLNKDYIEFYLRPGGAEWAEDDGTVFLRTSGDSYSARYAMYGECLIVPSFHAHLKGLAV